MLGLRLPSSAPLVGPDWLHSHLNHPRLRIVDCRWYLDEPDRGAAEFAVAAIPGAVYLSLDADLSAAEGPGRHPLPLPSVFTDRLGRAGISPDDTVVAYDTRGGAIASRLWWMLRWIGHEPVAVLDGGLQKWEAAGHPVEPGGPPHQSTAYPSGRTVLPIVDRDELVSLLGTVTLVDARSPERYSGANEPIDPIAGHIPTAVNRPYTDNLEDDLTFRPATELADLHASDSATTVAYCGSGVTACHDLLAMEIAGIEGGVLYPGSWSDWCSTGFDVATGD